MAPSESPRLAATGFALAGGRGRRMGCEKALLPWGASTLLDHALTRLREVCPQVAVLPGATTRFTDHGAPVFADVVTDAGPLGGILTGLLVMEHEIGLFLAVDLPLVPAGFLRYLVQLADQHDAVVPVAGGRPEPVCAVYRRSCLPAIRRRLEQGQRAVWSFWSDISIRRVDEADLDAFGGIEILRNLNTPAEYQSARTTHGS